MPGELPTFNPGVIRRPYPPSEGIFKLDEYKRFIGLPRLDFMGSHKDGDVIAMGMMAEQLRRSGPLEEIGRGGDMIAYSRPELSFVIKFPYEDYTDNPIGFTYRLAYGYSLAKEFLGDLFVPSLDVYGEFIKRNGEKKRVLTLAQQKIPTLTELFSHDSVKDDPEKVNAIKEGFVSLNQKMWERGYLIATLIGKKIMVCYQMGQ